MGRMECPRQIALRFLLRRPSLFAIPKASRLEHAAENAAAADIRLTEAELVRIDAAFPLGPQPRELPTLWTLRFPAAASSACLSSD